MRILVLTALAAIVVVGACQRTTGVELTDAQRAAITSQVADAVDSLFADMNAHDPDRIFEHYRKSEDFLYVSVSSTMRGWETFSSVTRSYDTAHPDVKFEYEILQTQVLAPNVAVVTILGSATNAEHLMWTEVFVLEDGRWVITLLHESWPGAAPPPAPHPTGGAPATVR